MNRTIRVGSVPYLNSKPLIEGYSALEGLADFVFDPPSRLSARMARKELDIALGSSVEYLRGDIRILPGVGIISRGAVNSVLLTGEGPIKDAQSVNLDPSSLTSCALVALWYKERLGRTPSFSRFSIESDEARRCDARLAIGDAALQRSGSSPHQLDMGCVWEEWVGYPFVYAVWLVREGVDLGEVGNFLASAPARVAGGMATLADEASQRLGLEREVCVEYLTHSLQFLLDEESLHGLQEFLSLAAKHHDWLSEVIDGFPPLGLSLPVEIEFYDLSQRRLSTGS